MFAAAALLFLYPIAREKAESQMLVLKDYLISRLEDRIARRISYESVSPSIFQSFEISNLKIRNTESGVPILEAGSLSIRYSLLGLLFGNARDALQEIVLENASLNFDTETDADILAVFGGQEKPSGEISQPWTPVKLTGRNIELHLRSGGNQVSAENMFFQIRPELNAYDVRLKAALSYTNNAEDGILRRGGAVVDLRGTVNDSYTSGETILGLSMLSSDVFDLKKQVFQLSFSPEGLLLRKIQDSAPIDLSLAYSPDTGEIRLDMFSEYFRPASLVTMKQDYSSLNEMLETGITSRGSLLYRLSSGELSYELDFAADIQHSGFPPQTRLAGRIEGTKDSMDFLPLTVSVPYGEASFRGNLALSTFYPAGNLEIKNFRIPGSEPLNAGFRVTRGSAGVNVVGNSITWGENVFSEVVLGIRPSARNVRFDGSIKWDEEEDAVARASFLLPLDKEGTQKLSVNLQDIPLKTFYLPLAGVFPGISALPSLDTLLDNAGDMDIRIGGTLLAENILEKNASFQIPRISVFRQDARNTHHLSISGSYNTKHWEISEWEGAWDLYYGRGNAAGDFLPSGRMNFSSAVHIMDVPYNFQGTFDPDGYLQLSGNYGLAAGLTWRSWGDYSGYFSLNDFPVPTLYDVMRISSIINFRYADKGSWGLKTDSVRIIHFAPSAHIRADIICAFDLGPAGGKLTDFQYTDSISALLGDAQIAYSFDPLSVHGKLNLYAREDSVEQYSLNLAYTEGSLAGTLAFIDSPLERFSAQTMTGKLSGLLDFAGIPENPYVYLNLDSSQGKINSIPASLHFDGKLENQAVSISSFELSYDTFRLSDTLVEYNVQEGNLSLAGLVNNKTAEGDITWFLGGDFNFGENLDWDTYSFERFLNSTIRGQMQFSTPSQQIAQEFRTWQFIVKKEGRDIRVEGGYNNSFEAFFEDSGNFSIHLRDPFPITFDAEGYFTPTEMEADINRIAFQLDDTFSRFFDFGILRLTRGQVMGNLRLSGDPFDPDIYGTVAVNNGYAKLKVVPEELGPYRGNIIFREKSFTVQPMIVPVGDTGGSAIVSGEFHLNNWIPNSIAVTVDTQDSSGVHIANNFGGIIIDGTAQGVLKIEGDLRRINVDGDIIASRTLITTGDAADEQKTTEPQTLFTTVRMDIEAGSGVELALPTVDFPIIQTFSNRGEKISFHWDEETGDFLLNGEISARGGEIFWFDRRFFIREGTARFNERAGSFDPFVSVRAELRETTSDGLVRIYLISDPTPVSQFSPRFESDQGYTNAEILAVLGSNIFGSSGEDALNIASAVPFTGEILTQIGVVKTVEKSVRDFLNLDLFSVRTHVIQNLLQNVVTSNRDQNSSVIEQRDRNIPAFGRYLDKTSLFLGKYIGSDLFLDFLLQLRAEDLFVREEDTYGGLVVDAEIVLEWRTPFFLLEWSLMPKHPDELFIFDNVFTFRWRFAF